MAAIKLNHVDKVFRDGTRAVRDVSLTIDDGRFVVLVGPSGCGKSTLLRIIAGLEEVTAGDVHIGDTRVNDLAPKDRDVAMVFQNYALYPHMSVYDNLGFALKMRRTPRGEIDTRVRETARTLGIDALLRKMPRDLSGGERQRVALGRAIVRDPQVFLFDEPLSNLDAKLRTEMRAEIAALHRRLGVTTVYVTHDQVEAMTMGERIVVLKEGGVQQQGAPLEVYDRPANRFVAEFIGSPAMNFLAAEVVAGETWGLRIGNIVLPLPDDVSRALETGTRRSIVLGLRPEHVRLCDENGIPARVALIERTGGDTLVHTMAGDTRVVVRAANVAAPKVGTHVHLRVELDHAHFFDTDTQLRIEVVTRQPG